MRISSSSVPGRRVGRTIPTTPRHNVKLIGPLLDCLTIIGSAASAAQRGDGRALSPCSD